MLLSENTGKGNFAGNGTFKGKGRRKLTADAALKKGGSLLSFWPDENSDKNWTILAAGGVCGFVKLSNQF